MTYDALRTDGDQPKIAFTFHGTGASASQLHGLAQEFLPGHHVVSPEGDVDENGAARFFRRTGEGVYDMDDLARAVDKMAGFIEAEVTRTGASRVIGLGYSNGANILAAVMLKQPALVTEAVLMHPLIPWDPEPQPGLSGARLLVTAGEADPICPAPRTRALLDYLSAQGAQVTDLWHPGGHEIRQEEVQAVQGFLR